MANYIREVHVEALTFHEFVEYGKQHCEILVNNMPWSFSYKGHPVTHENDEMYLISSGNNRDFRFTPQYMLVSEDNGDSGVELYLVTKNVFNEIFAPTK